jgi:multiple sugar transport system permease protein
MRALVGAALFVFIVFPIVWVGLSSFKTESEVRDNSFLPCPSGSDSALCFEPTLGNYDIVFDTFDFGSALVNSMSVGLLVVLVTVPFAALGAYALARYDIPAKRMILVVILATQFFPPVVLVLPYFSFFRTLDMEGLVGAIDVFGLLGEDAIERVAAIVSLTIINTSRTIPFCMWLLFGFFEGLPKAIEEAARIDGCSEWAVFRRIIMPLALPGLLTSAIFAFLLSWNEYLYAFLIGNNAITAPVAMARTVGERDVLWEQISAAGIMVMVPMLALAFAIRKYFISGITMGAVK